jgi:hypothetical protein
MERADWIQALAGYYYELLISVRASAAQHVFDIRPRRASKDYLLQDLAALRDGAIDAAPSVISAFWDNAERRVSEDDASTLEEGSVLPFPSDNRQQRVVRAADRYRRVVVSGPPGTGRSQTMANLVCHLVARGQRVLVSGQEDKGLEVLSELLAGLNVDYLSMTLLKDDAGSKKILADGIEGLQGHVGGLSAHGLAQAQQPLHDQREEERRLAGQVGADFEKLPAAEPGYGSADERYALLKNLDLIPADDYLPVVIASQVLEALPRAVNLQLSCLDVFEQLEAWHRRAREIVAAETAPIPSESLQRVAELGRHVLELLKSSRPRLVVERLTSDGRFKSEMADRLFPAIPDVREALERWLSDLLQLAAQDSEGHWADVAARLSTFRADDIERFRRLIGEADSAAHEAFDLRESTPEVIGDWIRYWSSRRVALNRCEVLPSYLGDTLSPLVDDDIARWSAEIALRILVLRVAEAERQARAATDGLACGLFVVEEVRRLKSLEDLQVLAADAEVALDIVSSIRRMERLIEGSALKALEGPLRQLMMSLNSLSPEDAGSCEALDRLARALPAFSELIGLLEGPLKSLPRFAASLLAEARATGEGPTLLTNLEQVIEAYNLRMLIARPASEFPQTTQGPAQAVRRSREALLDDSRKLLQVLINRRLLEACSRKSFAEDIHLLERTVRKSRRSYKRFEELRSDFNLDALLMVFPCWIMGLEDVYRVFPLKPGLFDYVIIDEASRCHQPGGLPVLLRAKRAVIIGDKGRLPNADVMVLPNAVVHTNYERFGIGELPRSNVFDAKKHSLLDVCTVFADGVCDLP